MAFVFAAVVGDEPLLLDQPSCEPCAPGVRSRGRPDGDDWHKTGERFQYLQSQGFRIFASVGVNSFSYIKPDISAVICDRLHPDGTTLRHSRSRYLQFYNAEDIIDLSVRPDLGVDW